MKIRKSTTWISLSLMISFALSPVAQAQLSGAAPSPGATGDVPWPTEQAYCDNVCPLLSDSSGEMVGINGEQGWNSTDDQWCANHNQQTNPSILASPAPIGSGVPSEMCTSATYYPGDTSCTDTTRKSAHCQFHNSQVEKYCMAYQGAKEAGAGQKMVLALDMAATGLCATACVMEMSSFGTLGTTQQFKKICDYAATSAGAAELLVTLTQKSSALGKMADAALAGAGITEGVMGLRKNNSKYINKSSCITAATLAALSGVRVYNMGYGERTRKSSCGSAYSLSSSSTLIGASNLMSTGIASGGSASSTTASSGAAIGSGSNQSLSQQVACIQNPSNSSNCSSAQRQISAATDGGILTSSGLDKLAADKLAAADLSGLSKAMDSGAGSLMSRALGSGAGDFGAKLAEIAQTAQDHAAELGLSGTANYTSASGGAKPAANSEFTFGKGFGFDSPQMTAEKSETVFGRTPASAAGDIWHTGYHGSIFQIVSGKITQTKDRVESADWSTPLNRALMGLPAIKTSQKKR
jgi:hypothetical protein